MVILRIIQTALLCIEILGVIDAAVYYCISHAGIDDTFHPPTFRSLSCQTFMSNIQVVEDTVVTRFSVEIRGLLEKYPTVFFLCEHLMDYNLARLHEPTLNLSAHA